MNPKSFHLITLKGTIDFLERGREDQVGIGSPKTGRVARFYAPKGTADGLEIGQHVEIEVHVFDPAERTVVESNGEEGPANAPGD